MNFRAHALLADHSPALRIGGVIGDFVKGRLPAGLAQTMTAMAARIRRDNPLAGAEHCLLADRGSFAIDCSEFLHDARSFASRWISAQANRSATATVRDPAPPDAD